MSAVAEHPSTALPASRWRDPAVWIALVDALAILLALSLPWSTSLVAIFAVLMLLALVPFFDVAAFLRTLKQPISMAPLALFLHRARRHAVVGRRLGHEALRRGTDGQASGAAISVLPFRALAAWRMGVCGFPRLLHAVDGDVLDCGVRARADPESQGRGGLARHLRQELHRSEPGIYAVRGGAGLSGDHAAARREGSGRRCCSCRDRDWASSSTWCSWWCRAPRS